MITFSQFFSDIKKISAPEGVGSNVLTAFRNYVVNGLIRTQTYVPCLKENNVDFYAKSSAKDFCNADIINGPNGQWQQVYAFKPGRDCRKYYYTPVTTNAINCWIDTQKCAACDATDPPTTNVYEDPYCNYVIDGDDACAPPYTTTTEDDTVFTGCVDRMFAKGPDNKLYLAPRFPCGYLIAIHWLGIKRCYRDSDPVWEDDDIKHAVAKFAEAELALKDRDTQSWQALMITYQEMIRDIAHRCRVNRRTPTQPDCSVDSLLPFVNPLFEANPYTSDGLYAPDVTAPVITCS